jgi:hypothetical protein
MSGARACMMAGVRFGPAFSIRLASMVQLKACALASIGDTQ